MAKKKVNVRKDYSYAAKKSLPKYESGAKRKTLYLILRGPGWDARQVLVENEELKAFAARNRLKLKFLQAKDEVEFIQFMKEANVWALGIVFDLGTLTDTAAQIRTAAKRLLIAISEVGPGVKQSKTFVEALQLLTLAKK